MRCPGLTAFLIAASVMASATTLLPAPGAAQSLRDVLPFGRTHRIAKLLQTVVNISTHKLPAAQTDPGAAKGEARRIEAFSSGFIIDPSGLIVTNRHVVERALDVTVTLSDGTALPAKVRGTGRTIDIALLEITPPRPLPTVTWGDSDKVRVGDQVLAVGNPLGIGESVSGGIVSAKNRDVDGDPVRRLHPDRRGDQSWQLRRTVVRHAWRGDRGEHRTLYADRAKRTRWASASRYLAMTRGPRSISCAAWDACGKAGSACARRTSRRTSRTRLACRCHTAPS